MAAEVPRMTKKNKTPATYADGEAMTKSDTDNKGTVSR